MLLRAILALLLLLPAGAAAQNLDSAVSALVRIVGERDGTPVRGSGFVVGLDRDLATIVTASHVIEGVTGVAVIFAADPSATFPADRVLGMEAGNPRGLAVFQVRGALPAGLRILRFDAEAQLGRGEELFVLGFPRRAKAPLALRRTFAGPDGNLLQLDLPAGEGLSGSPVLRGGQVVGVVTDEDPLLTFAVGALVARNALLGWGVRFGEATDSQRAKSTPGPSTPPRPEEVASPKPCIPGEERTEKGMVFVRLCAGTFTMGSAATDRQAASDEKPAHEVTLSEFWIGKTEVTNEQYRRFHSNHQGKDKLPATDIVWAEANAACAHFGGRLPTEAEWEYAARAGSRMAWSFGDDEKKLGEHAWYETNPGGRPHPVGTRKPNAWGVHDMPGNVWEWVGDWYGPYSSAVQQEPTGPATGTSRVLRGGSFFFPPWGLRSAHRVKYRPVHQFMFIGFRCVRPPADSLDRIKAGVGPL